MSSTHTGTSASGLTGGPLGGAAMRFASMPVIWRLLSLAIFFTIWEIAGRSNFNWAFPSFSRTLVAFFEMVADGSLASAYLKTIEPLGIGLVISLVSASPQA